MAASASSTSAIRPLVAGNWKMNGLRAALSEAEAVKNGLAGAVPQVMLCPPTTLISSLSDVASGSDLLVGAQDCHTAENGAHTGDVSAQMLKDAGACAVIVGHSERRTDHGELDRIVCAKAQAAHAAGLTAIICIGETEGERRAGLTLKVVTRQLAGSLPSGATAQNTVIAYEPVWAIGTGLTPTAGDVADVHASIRAALGDHCGADGASMRILYGGSVKPANAKELMAVANVDGALVGGASLKAADFLGIVTSYA